MGFSSRRDCDVISRKGSGSSDDERPEASGVVSVDTVMSSSSSSTTGFLVIFGMRLVSVENQSGFLITTGFVDFLADFGELLFLDRDRAFLAGVVGDVTGVSGTADIADDAVD